ncbi:DUF6210 family protein [Rhizocola hellebori]|nr:DUF6210 family protein [Rhizocola hellebori]
MSNNEETTIHVDFNPQDAVPEVLGLIVAAPTGVLYGNQCGGLTCLYQELEGYLVNVGRAQSFIEFFAKFKGRPPIGAADWSETDLAQLAAMVRDEVFYFVEESGGGDSRIPLALDSTNVQRLTEGWIPIRAGEQVGALVFANSD